MYHAFVLENEKWLKNEKYINVINCEETTD